ncbi:VOC family protein [Hymenobacter lapidiphilus]|uniref:VOC family protein n=1 Tax=Hymenobacter lapidiphilus TaxID=2608003 RepID=A0A7Y7PQX5_9BACT|nr:VOC family protein [Hymenobacter lapidiphilus]NVO32257.1 VOC family protein [Hymenobacter lapidiphilus]
MENPSNTPDAPRAAYPVAFNHVGLNVPDLDQALAWYQQLFGFTVLMGPYEVEGQAGLAGQIYVDIAGATMRKTRVAQVAMGNGIGLEMFQFLDPATPAASPIEELYYKPGPWHLAFTHPDVEGLLARILAAGGRPISQVWSPIQDQDQFKLVYCYDPFGNVLELFSHSYEQMLANR